MRDSLIGASECTEKDVRATNWHFLSSTRIAISSEVPAISRSQSGEVLSPARLNAVRFSQLIIDLSGVVVQHNAREH